MVRSINNEVSSKVLYIGTEATPGVAVAPDYRLTGTYTANETAALNRSEETTGGYDRFLTASRSPSTFDGSYAERLTFETLPMLMQYGLRKGLTGVTDGAATPGYTYAKFPSFNTDDVATFTAEHFVDGLGFRNTGVRFSEWTISGDSDAAEGAWMFSSSNYMRSNEELDGAFTGAVTSSTPTVVTMTGAGWTINALTGSYVYMDSGTHDGEVRLIVSNTATTFTVDEAFVVTPIAADVFRIEGLFPAGIPIPDRNIIPTYGTTVTLATDFAGLAAATAVDGRIISWNVNYNQAINPKRFMENSINEYSERTGKGSRIVSGAIRFEFDRRDEWLEWRNTSEIALSINQIGPIINVPTSTTHLASIVVPRAYWDTVTPDERESNLTMTAAFLAYLHPTEPIVTVTAKNTLIVLP